MLHPVLLALGVQAARFQPLEGPCDPPDQSCEDNDNDEDESSGAKTRSIEVSPSPKGPDPAQEDKHEDSRGQQATSYQGSRSLGKQGGHDAPIGPLQKDSRAQEPESQGGMQSNRGILRNRFEFLDAIEVVEEDEESNGGGGQGKTGAPISPGYFGKKEKKDKTEEDEIQACGDSHSARERLTGVLDAFMK